MNKNSIIYIIIGVVVLMGLFYFLKPKSAATPSYTPSPSSESTSSGQTTGSTKTFDLVVKNKKLVSGPDTLTVTEGDQVSINIISDEAEELHLHGYDKSVDLEASKEAQLNFTANLTGRFPYELEKSKTDIGALEVQPK